MKKIIVAVALLSSLRLAHGSEESPDNYALFRQTGDVQYLEIEIKAQQDRRLLLHSSKNVLEYLSAGDRNCAPIAPDLLSNQAALDTAFDFLRRKSCNIREALLSNYEAIGHTQGFETALNVHIDLAQARAEGQNQ